MFNSTNRAEFNNKKFQNSQEFIEQLREHSKTLPQPIARMILVFEECNFCYFEVCNLQLDCIKQNTNGEWHLTYYKQKIKKETTISISPEIAKVIQEQQKYIKEVFDTEFPFLFCSRQQGSTRKGEFIPAPKPMSINVFAKYFRRWKYRC